MALSTPESPSEQWLSLTDLGRLFGISAVSCGRRLIQAGLREPSGRPSDQALRLGLARPATAPHRGRATLWQQAGCQAALEREGLAPLANSSLANSSLVEQWAELLWALKQGSPSISTSAEQMAEDLPRELVGAVNRQLQDKGWSFQVGSRPARTPAAASQRSKPAATHGGRNETRARAGSGH